MKPGTYIDFVEGLPKARTNTFEVVNRRSGSVIGSIEWYGPWRQYCFFPRPDTVYSDGCLEEIAAACQEASKNQRMKRA